jgi:hypothetical protein
MAVQAPAMAKKTKDAAPPPDDRVIVVVLKDSEEYRDWVDGLSESTLIPVATIVRDALTKWAEDRGLPAPPTSAVRRRRRRT